MANRTSHPAIGAAGRGRRSAVLLVACVVLTGLLAACGGSSSASSDSITLYNGQHEQTTDALVARFEKETGIKVNVRSDDEDVLASQINAEGSNSPADVFYTENSPPLEYLQEQGPARAGRRRRRSPTRRAATTRRRATGSACRPA